MLARADALETRSMALWSPGEMATLPVTWGSILFTTLPVSVDDLGGDLGHVAGPPLANVA